MTSCAVGAVLLTSLLLGLASLVILIVGTGLIQHRSYGLK